MADSFGQYVWSVGIDTCRACNRRVRAKSGIAPGLRAPPARLETWAFWLSLKKISAPIERSIPVAAYCPLHGPDSTSRGFFTRATRVPRTRTRARHPVHPAGRRWGCCEPAEESRGHQRPVSDLGGLPVGPDPLARPSTSVAGETYLCFGRLAGWLLWRADP
jgi:hypothetical protein